jgi:hypothetical protein
MSLLREAHTSIYAGLSLHSRGKYREVDTSDDTDSDLEGTEKDIDRLNQPQWGNPYLRKTAVGRCVLPTRRSALADLCYI